MSDNGEFYIFRTLISQFKFNAGILLVLSAVTCQRILGVAEVTSLRRCLALGQERLLAPLRRDPLLQLDKSRVCGGDAVLADDF